MTNPRSTPCHITHDTWTSVDGTGIHLLHTAGGNVAVHVALDGSVVLPNLPRGQWRVRGTQQ